MRRSRFSVEQIVASLKQRTLYRRRCITHVCDEPFVAGPEAVSSVKPLSC